MNTTATARSGARLHHDRQCLLSRLVTTELAPSLLLQVDTSDLNDRARFSCTLEQFSGSVVRDENGNSPCECSRGDTPQGREFPCRRLSPNCVISSSNGSSKICMPVARPSCVSAT